MPVGHMIIQQKLYVKTKIFTYHIQLLCSNIQPNAMFLYAANCMLEALPISTPASGKGLL